MRLPKWRRDEELDEEIRTHLDMAVRDRMERGESAEQARKAVLREFGNVGLVKEVTRDMWGWRSLEQLAQDLRYGGRMLVKQPGFTLIAVITLALGIGACTAIFSVVNGVLLNPLPFAEPDRLVMIYGKFLSYGSSNLSLSVPDFVDCRDRTSSFEQLAAYDDFSANLADTGGEPERVEALAVTPDLFTVLKVTPLYGRAFLPE